MEFDLSEIHEAALSIAKKGGAHTLSFFNENVQVHRKEDDSPVTIADRQAEEVMRKEIEALFPGHGILGEEHGKTNEESAIQWILDPIDGTQSFIHGVPLYTTLIGVLVDGEPVVGIVYAPALDELCDAAKGRGARLNGNSCSVRPCTSLDKATFLSTDASTPSKFGFGEEFQYLLDNTRMNRTWGDAYGHMLVATGRADIMFDPVLNIWDAAPLLTLMQEAGGAFCDVQGEETIETGNGISCSREILPEVLEIFNS